MNAAGEPDVVLGGGLKRGDVLVMEYDSGDPFTTDDRKVEYIGVDTFAAEMKAEEDRECEEETERERLEKEKQTKEIVKRLGKSNLTLRAWLESLTDPESPASKAICAMPLFNGSGDCSDEEDSVFGPAIWLTKQNLTMEGGLPKFRNRDQIMDILFAAQDEFGYIVWSDELQGKHGRDWKPLAKVA
jgi:hypothetical protein